LRIQTSKFAPASAGLKDGGENVIEVLPTLFLIWQKTL
jgi:hypothetical protein